MRPTLSCGHRRRARARARWWGVLATVLMLRAHASESMWDYLPLVGYEQEELSLALRPGGGTAGWSAVDAHGAAIALHGDQQTLSFALTPAASGEVKVLLANNDRRIAIDFVHPGAGAALALDAQGRLHRDQDLAVLVLPRLEAQPDRRWAVLGLLERPAGQPCSLTVAEPQVGWGEPALVAQICASQRLQPTAAGVLVRLSGADRLAGWKHREYRQVLAWLVADLLARGALRVVLVEPVAPAAEAAVMQPLRDQIADVGRTYHCRVVETAALGRDSDWEVADGVLGTTLNARGQAAFAELLLPYLHQP
jgi:hypothetical protein